MHLIKKANILHYGAVVSDDKALSINKVNKFVSFESVRNTSKVVIKNGWQEIKSKSTLVRLRIVLEIVCVIAVIQRAFQLSFTSQYNVHISTINVNTFNLALLCKVGCFLKVTRDYDKFIFFPFVPFINK